jgi:hypothetical protein
MNLLLLLEGLALELPVEVGLAANMLVLLPIECGLSFGLLLLMLPEPKLLSELRFIFSTTFSNVYGNVGGLNSSYSRLPLLLAFSQNKLLGLHLEGVWRVGNRL